MFELVPMTAEHLITLLDEPMNAPLIENFADIELIKKSDPGAVLVNGVPTVCGGVNEYWKGRGHLWSVFSEKSKYNFVPTFRGIQAYVQAQLEQRFERIEMSMACDFLQAHRRAKMLGFQMEIYRAEKYLFGQDCSIYSLVRK